MNSRRPTPAPSSRRVDDEEAQPAPALALVLAFVAVALVAAEVSLPGCSLVAKLEQLYVDPDLQTWSRARRRQPASSLPTACGPGFSADR